MRIIAGKARATKLYTLEGLETRPTLDRVKESIFNIIQNEIPESIFLDLFSGSGAMGLEAVSRGAKKAILCEKAPKAIAIIQKNIEKTHLEKQVELYKGDYAEYIKAHLTQKPDIVYIDPPYQTNDAVNAVKKLQQKQALKSSTLGIIETDRETEIINELENMKQIKIEQIRKYGRVSLIFFKQHC